MAAFSVYTEFPVTCSAKPNILHTNRPILKLQNIQAIVMCNWNF